MGLDFCFYFYDSNHQRVHYPIGIIFKNFYAAERLGLGPEYLEYAPEAAERVHMPNIALAKYWVDNCVNHCYHRDEAGTKIRPSRLIEVLTGHGSSLKPVARLCEAEEFSADVSYLTLSHCWGGNTMLTLTKGNLEALRQEIPVRQLPDLLKDALCVTCQLGVKYIWIDCLCILQDCQDDWEYEAGRMGDVYKNAKCNIAASGYEDGKISLFKERTSIPLLNFPLCMDRILVANHETLEYPARMPLKGIYVRSDIGEFENAVTKGPLNSRGWVAQERALSPGILHFTPKQMWWECRDHIFCESFPFMDFTRDFEQSSNPLHNHIRVTGGRQDLFLIWKWNMFMGFYAGTDLTVWSDRFPAITGIARRFATLAGGNFVAGFWSGNLIPSLAWTVSDSGHAKKIPYEQLAPSWSWAFHCIPHEPGYAWFKWVVPVSTCRRVLSDDPGFRSDLQYRSLGKSAVRGLEMTGPLRKLPVEAEKLVTLQEWIDYDLEVHVHYDVADQGFFSATDVADEEWHWLWEEPTHMLPLINEGFPDLWMSCLLLSRVLGLEYQNTFRRVGLLRIHFRDQDTCNEALGLDNGTGEPQPSTLFEESGLHDVILV